MLAKAPVTRILLAVAAGLATGAAVAKLPPPTPEEVAKKEKASQEKKAQTEQAQNELDQVEDRIVRRYRAEHGQRAPPPSAKSVESKEPELPAGAKLPGVPHPDTGR
jgi:ribulose kinase